MGQHTVAADIHTGPGKEPLHITVSTPVGEGCLSVSLPGPEAPIHDMNMDGQGRQRLLKPPAAAMHNRWTMQMDLGKKPVVVPTTEQGNVEGRRRGLAYMSSQGSSNGLELDYVSSQKLACCWPNACDSCVAIHGSPCCCNGGGDVGGGAAARSVGMSQREGTGMLAGLSSYNRYMRMPVRRVFGVPGTCNA
mmetsp:Transcript_33317/g.94403  ORF Transcript_33317/g.94403 Transcript_33317/m.94403 type:complete len:192 (+) Transcript_33317:985-1560(+)